MKNYELLDVVKVPELFCNHSYITEVHHTYISTSFYVELKAIIFFAIEVKPNTEGWIGAILFSLQRQIFLSVGKGKEGGASVSCSVLIVIWPSFYQLTAIAPAQNLEFLIL